MKYKDLVTRHEQIISNIDMILFQIKVSKNSGDAKYTNSLKSSLKYQKKKFEQSSIKISNYIEKIIIGEIDAIKNNDENKK